MEFGPVLVYKPMTQGSGAFNVIRGSGDGLMQDQK